VLACGYLSGARCRLAFKCVCVCVRVRVRVRARARARACVCVSHMTQLSLVHVDKIYCICLLDFFLELFKQDKQTVSSHHRVI